MSANKAFGVFLESQNASEYIKHKKIKIIKRNLNHLQFNKSNLYINLITKLDLNDVYVISNFNTNNHAVINDKNITSPYKYLNIDPNGILFGNTSCTINAYKNFLLYYPQDSITIHE